MASSGEPVVLALYDLSQGMAAQMSQQFLGMQIDMIPHTGVVVYGKEYFFGGGIQALPHAQFVASHMPPVKMIPMGNTEIPKATFEEFLQNIRPRFTQQTYDLIRNNCNNFSDAVCQFLVGKSVPEEITGLPDRVFSSPMGQMLRPMVEQMQGQLGASGSSPIPGFAGGGGGVPPAAAPPPPNPWAPASAPPPAPAAASSNPWSHIPDAAAASSSSSAAAPAASAASASNPWAHIPDAPSASAAAPAPAPTPQAPAVPQATTSRSSSSSSSSSQDSGSALDAYMKPLLSADAQAVPVLIRQLRSIAAAGETAAAGAAASPASPASPSSPSTEELVTAVAATTEAQSPLAAAVSASSSSPPASPTASSPKESSSADESSLLTPTDMDTLTRVGEALATNGQVPLRSFAILHRVLTVWPTKRLSVSSSKTDFLALCLLRLLVLQPSAWSYMQNNGQSRNECLDCVLAGLEKEDPGKHSSGNAVNACVMRLALAANLFSLPSGAAFVMDSPARMQRVLDGALRDLHQPLDAAPLRGVRQMASAALHNLAIHLPPPQAAKEPLPEGATQMMITCIEGLTSEPDDVVLRRRAIVFGHIVRSYGSSAKELVAVLGLGEELARAVVAAFRGENPNATPETTKVLRAVNQLF
jgi:hypothetical protein